MYKEMILNAKFFVGFAKSPGFEEGSFHQPGFALSLNRDAESV
jgi:hypothetical protein